MENIHELLLAFSQQVRLMLGKDLSRIILYGSYAREEQRNNSDIDLMILTTLTEDEISRIENKIFDIAYDFELRYAKTISVIIKNEKHFNYWLGALPFYDTVNKEGVVLNG